MTENVNTYLQELNRHPRDVDIQFDEPTHIYTVRGDKSFTSVTTWIHQHFGKFDSEKIVDGIMNRGLTLTDPTYKYYGMKRQEILDTWSKNGENASGAGTKMHYDIECFYNNIHNENNDIDFKYFLDFAKDNAHLKPFRTEWCVFNEDLKIAGSIDMLYENPDGTILIYDWKRVKNLEYEPKFNKYGLPKCLQKMPDTNFWHYTLQLNIYRSIIETKYKKRVSGMCLVCLHPENYGKTYDVVDIPFLDKEITDIIELRKTNMHDPGVGH